MKLPLVVAMMLILCPPLHASSGKGGVDPAKVRQELRQILSAREYDHTVKSNAFDRFVSHIGQTVWDAILRAGAWLLRHITLDGSSASDVVATLGTWAVLVGFVVLLWFVGRKLIANYSRAKRTGEDSEASSFDLPTAKPLMKQAAKLAESGDYRAAFRAAYVACIAYLDEIRALRFERSRTNWEYLRELKQGGHERPYSEMHPLTLDFDRKIYGRENCSKTDYEGVAAAYNRLSSEEAK